MSDELIVRCNNHKCLKAHLFKIRDPDSNQSFSILCKCANKINGNYENQQLIVTGATLSERNKGEAVFIHEPELKQ